MTSPALQHRTQVDHGLRSSRRGPAACQPVPQPQPEARPGDGAPLRHYVRWDRYSSRPTLAVRRGQGGECVYIEEADIVEMRKTLAAQGAA